MIFSAKRKNKLWTDNILFSHSSFVKQENRQINSIYFSLNTNITTLFFFTFLFLSSSENGGNFFFLENCFIRIQKICGLEILKLFIDRQCLNAKSQEIFLKVLSTKVEIAVRYICTLKPMDIHVYTRFTVDLVFEYEVRQQNLQLRG